MSKSKNKVSNIEKKVQEIYEKLGGKLNSDGTFQNKVKENRARILAKK